MLVVCFRLRTFNLRALVTFLFALSSTQLYYTVSITHKEHSKNHFRR